MSAEGLIQTSLFNKLTTVEKEIALATVSPKIKDIEPDKFIFLIDGLIAKTHLNCGFKHDLEQVNSTIDELCEDLKKYNSAITFEEIQLAFKNGYKKQYGDFFGLNNATYFQWVNAYVWSENRLRIKKLLSDAKEKAKQPEAKIISEQEANEIMKNACLKSFEYFKLGSVIFDSGNVKYNFLVKMELLNFSKERKNEILARITNKIKSEAVESKNRTESISQVLGKISEESLISESKKECLKVYFKDLLDTGIELSELME